MAVCSISRPDGSILCIDDHGDVEFLVTIDNLHIAFHRDRGPAVIRSDGTIVYYMRDMYHRSNGPAVVQTSYPDLYYINGIRMLKVEYFLQQGAQ